MTCDLLILTLICLNIFQVLQAESVDLDISIGQPSYQVSAVVTDGHASVQIDLGKTPLKLKIPTSHLDKGIAVSLPAYNNVIICVKKCTAKAPVNHDLHMYVMNFLQWYFVILQMKDCIHEGDIFRTNVNLKMMIPFFYSHSVLSKKMSCGMQKDCLCLCL